MQADSAWCLPNQLTAAQADQFFANRATEGFNTVLITWACGPYIGFPADGAAFDGLTPFNDGNWSSPNADYWSRFDQYVASAASHGIELLIDTDTGSFLDQMTAQGATVMRDFGSFLGARYAAATNVMWMQGNDYFGNDDDVVLAVGDGIRAAAPDQLQTVELWPRASTSNDDPNVPSHTDMTTAYSYYPTYDQVLKAYNGTPGPKPVLMIEANYEGENNTGGPATTDETIRRQIYWSLTSGASGQFYGNVVTYMFKDPAWPQNMATPAVAQNTLASKLFRSLPWESLVPDSSFITAGAGTYDSGPDDVLESDYATAARTPDGAHAVVYVPTARTLTVDSAKLQANSTAQWFDPTTGEMQSADEPYTTPGTHADGTSDWVLVFGATDGTPPTTTTTTTTSSTTTTTTTTTPTTTSSTSTTTSTTPTTTSTTSTTTSTTTTTTPSTTSTTTTTLVPGVPRFEQIASATPQSRKRSVGVWMPDAQTDGDLNVVAISWNDMTASITSVVDSQGNTYEVGAGVARDNGMSQAIYYAANIAGGSNKISVTFSRPARYVDVRVAEYSGVSALQGAGSSTGLDGTASVTLSTDSASLVVAAGATTNFFTTPGEGWNMRIVTGPNGDIVEDLIAPVTGTVSATATGDTGGWIMQAVAFI
jgi:hypothetical protein